MKSINSIQTLLILTILFFAFNTNAQTEKKEVFIIGTMHQVPKYLKNSYKPLYKSALKYEPEAIYVENNRPEDTISQMNSSSKFIAYSDSIKNTFEYDDAKFNALMDADLRTLCKKNFRYLAKSFAIKRDYANYTYYKYLFAFGLKGAKKPLRNENSDITHKLALKLNMKYIYSMDDQSDRAEYHKAWRACSIEGQKNGDNEISKKMSKKIRRTAILPAIFGRHGKWTNNYKTMMLFHIGNSFRYSNSDCEPCKEGMKYWDLRNRKMAKNIGDQVTANNHQKNLVVVGAGHVIGLKEELEKAYPHLSIKIMEDKPYKNNDNSTQLESNLITKK